MPRDLSKIKVTEMPIAPSRCTFAESCTADSRVRINFFSFTYSPLDQEGLDWTDSSVSPCDSHYYQAQFNAHHQTREVLSYLQRIESREDFNRRWSLVNRK